MKKIMFLTICVLFAMFFTCFALAKGNEISPGIDYLRKKTTLEKCDIKGNEIKFTLADYEKTFGEEISFISMTTLPDAKTGKLKLNGTDVILGQTITAKSLDYLVFLPNKGAVKSSFTFRSSADGWSGSDILCNITILERQNFAPIIKEKSKITVQNVCCSVPLDAYDPDNDTIQYFIEKYPSNGNAKIINNSLTYMPLAQYTGKDTVSVYAVDKFGNKSALVEVKINVEKNNLGFTFSDMKDNDAHLAAIELAEKSVIAYRYVSGEYLFGPEDKVSKIDFMIMLLSAANVDTAIKSDIQLKFKDLAKLPVEKQKYIKKAVEMGIIINNSTDFGFDKPVMKSEAAEWISKLLNLKITDNIDFIDIDKNQTDLKIYAAATIEFGIFSANGNKFEPKTVLTRDCTAIALKNVLDFLKNKD